MCCNHQQSLPVSVVRVLRITVQILLHMSAGTPVQTPCSSLPDQKHVQQDKQVCGSLPMHLSLQVWVGVVPTGPKGTPLNSSYQNRDSREYKEDLGYAVINFARMVPDGLLVFFPSYGVLKSCTDFWKNTSVAGSGMSHVSLSCFKGACIA